MHGSVALALLSAVGKTRWGPFVGRGLDYIRLELLVFS